MNWQNIVRSATDRADIFKLDKVLVYEKARRMLVSLFCDELCEEAEYVAVRREFRKAFPEFEVSLRVASPALACDFTADINKYRPFISEFLARKNPGIRHMLGACEWKLDGANLLLSTESASEKDLFAHHKIADKLSALLYDVFRLRVSVILSDRNAAAQQMERLENLRKTAEAAAPIHTPKPAPAKMAALMGGKFGEVTAMRDLAEDSANVTVAGEVITAEWTETRNDSNIMSCLLADEGGAVMIKHFVLAPRGNAAPQEHKKSLARLKEEVVPGQYLKVRGSCQTDDFFKSFVMKPTDISIIGKPKQRADNSEEKRVELHLHTHMSGMDGLSSAESLIKQAAKWGHKAIAVTDHGVTQAFPEAFATAKKCGLKLIPGMEGYLCDETPITENPRDYNLTDEIIVLDFETTGLSAQNDRVIEIGAVKLREGRVIDTFSQMVNPERSIPQSATKINHIHDNDVANAPTFAKLADGLTAFLADSPIAAHNASFDIAFLKKELERVSVKREFTTIDTLALSRRLYPGQKSYTLGNMCKLLKISLKDAHRAVNDATATAKLLNEMLDELAKKGITNLRDIEQTEGAKSLSRSHHITILAASQTGLTNLNRIVSNGFLGKFVSGRPHIPRSFLKQNREGLVLGSACASGELYAAALDGQDDKKLASIASFYDFVEIMPDGNNEFLLRENKVANEDALHQINRRLIKAARDAKLPVAATGDVHYLNPADSRFRAILQAGKGFSDADEQATLHFRTTDEMLEEFAYLGEALAREVVITNTNMIADRIGDIRLFPAHPENKQTFQPVWEEAASDIESMSYANAKALYGDPLPEIVDARLKKELKAIVGYGFSTLYSIAQKLVKRSLDDGFLVGSRGSVGSSFVATMCGITEVNPLPPHYVCPSCRLSDFGAKALASCGVDLPERICPNCGTKMNGEGFDIPFEVFLGFKGDKVPDIDLNFSGLYQGKAHKAVEDLFGKGYVYRAGTIGTLAQKTALFYVDKYCEARQINMPKAQRLRLAEGCVGVKRTTGQHPGGMVVLPKDYEIYQFTAVQHPADDADSETVTTHYDFSSMHDILVKLDILGHDDPTMIRMLEELTGVNARALPLNDAGVISLFTSPDALGVSSSELGSQTGTLGVPEFGTSFVRQMLVDTKPSSMDELVRISGLSHGTAVWQGNAKELIEKGVATLRECICTREDIMNYLIGCGVDDKTAFDTMESVRKGKGLTEAMESALISANVPAWIMESCRKIQYMFPKGHAVAYVTMALRIGWFKVYRPAAYYATFFTIRAVGFDALTMLGGADDLRWRIRQMNDRYKELSAKEKDVAALLELVLEMNLRGIVFTPIDIYTSDAENFTVVDEHTIRPPLNALPGLGVAAAVSIAEARRDGEFTSVEDLKARTHISTAVVDLLRIVGCLKNMPESNQLSFMDMLGGIA
ncbi:MAG: PolC-type DNA polymerase III [Oscillospiraceae bacterium]|jgi:DNA polymerase-3 subunit alpha (Gram-positive type)|nr:PolC-type DNA polymerase III [Oscillospiraceae bacterium]